MQQRRPSTAKTKKKERKDTVKFGEMYSSSFAVITLHHKQAPSLSGLQSHTLISYSQVHKSALVQTHLTKLSRLSSRLKVGISCASLILELRLQKKLLRYSILMTKENQQQ